MNLIRPHAWREFWALIRAYWWSSEKVSARQRRDQQHRLTGVPRVAVL